MKVSKNAWVAAIAGLCACAIVFTITKLLPPKGVLLVFFHETIAPLTFGFALLGFAIVVGILGGLIYSLWTVFRDRNKLQPPHNGRETHLHKGMYKLGQPVNAGTSQLFIVKGYDHYGFMLDEDAYAIIVMDTDNFMLIESGFETSNEAIEFCLKAFGSEEKINKLKFHYNLGDYKGLAKL